MNENENDKNLDIEKEELKKKKLAKLSKIKEDKDTEEKPKGKRGRKKKLEFSTSIIYAQLFNNILAKRDKKWQLNQDELAGITQATDTMLAKYSEVFEKYGAEFNFGFWLAMILLPRILPDFSSKDKKQKPIKTKNE